MQNGSDAGVYAQFFDGCASTRPKYPSFRLVIEILGSVGTKLGF